MTKKTSENAETTQIFEQNPDTYQHDAGKPAKSAKQFFAQRWVKITGISLAAAIALVGAFGVGVAAGERIAGNGSGGYSQGGFGGQFGGHDDFGGNGGSQFGGPQGGLNGGPGCPADDPDHCAGTDRNQHGFQAPSQSGSTNGGSTTGSSGNGTKS